MIVGSERVPAARPSALSKAATPLSEVDPAGGRRGVQPRPSHRRRSCARPCRVSTRALPPAPISPLGEMSSSVESGRPLALVFALCDALDREKIDYCHWKSNDALDRSASGENDLDLLVGRADVQRFGEILASLGFKQGRPPSHKELPAVLDYYGYDDQAGRFVHVHAHHQLILGDDLTKNYRLPVERPFLASATRHGLFRVPAPEFEFIVFVIRMVVKYLTWDAPVWPRTLPAAARRELAHLQARLQPEKIQHFLRLHLPFVSRDLFDRCVDALDQQCPRSRRLVTARKLQAALRAHARRGQIIDAYLKLSRRVLLVLHWLLRGKSFRKRLTNGGALIAIVGGDGAGKSTAVAELHTWLSKNFDTVQVHLGKPPFSRSGLSFARALLRVTSRHTGSSDVSAVPRSSPGSGPPARSSRSLSYAWLIRRVWTARARYRAYVKARRFATNGGIVVCDRYPLAQIKLMDGLQPDRVPAHAQSSRLGRYLLRRGQACYDQIMPPDLLIVLRVDPEIAVRRKTEEDPAAVRARCQEIWDLDWRLTPAHVVDANRPQPAVLAELKTLIWSAL